MASCTALTGLYQGNVPYNIQAGRQKEGLGDGSDSADMLFSPALQHNLEGVLGFQLAREDYERICAIPFQLRLVDGIRFLRPEGPFRWGAQPVCASWQLVLLSAQRAACWIGHDNSHAFTAACVGMSCVGGACNPAINQRDAARPNLVLRCWPYLCLMDNESSPPLSAGVCHEIAHAVPQEAASGRSRERTRQA